MRIVLTGAYGYTAQLIAARLQAENIPYSIAGRDETRLNDLKTRFAVIEKTIILDLGNREQVKYMVHQFDVFLNCAGPFTEEAGILLQELSASQNKVYLDITGESEFVRGSFEKFNGTAKKNRTLIIHANAFESLLADLAVEIAGVNPGEVKSCFTYYWFNHSKPSPGTRITMKLSKHRSFHEVINTAWAHLDTSAGHQPMRYRDEEMTAVPYPLPEMVFFFQNLHCENALSYLLVNREAARFMGEKNGAHHSLKEELDHLKQKKFSGPTEVQRSAQQFELRTDFLMQDGSKKSVILSGNDMYDLTAQLVLETTRLILQGISVHGVISPGVIHAGRAKGILERLNISVNLENQA
jgi:hypothetical protein